MQLDLIKMVKEKGKFTKRRPFFDSGEISSAHNLLNYIPSYKDLMTKTKILDLIKTFYKDITVGDFNSSYFAKPKYEGLEQSPIKIMLFCMEPANIATGWMPLTFALKMDVYITLKVRTLWKFEPCS